MPRIAGYNVARVLIELLAKGGDPGIIAGSRSQSGRPVRIASRGAPRTAATTRLLPPGHRRHDKRARHLGRIVSLAGREELRRHGPSPANAG
jgi:hypothetical protein